MILVFVFGIAVDVQSKREPHDRLSERGRLPGPPALP